MKERTYYQAVEYFDNTGGNLILSKKKDGKWITRFKTFETAQEVVNEAIQSRKNQMFYWRNAKNEVVDKISYWERYPLHYKIFKIIEQEEELFCCDNSEIELREPKNNLQEETDLL